MEVFVVSLLNGLVYGMLLFMLASGLTLILSMMGVLNFAHASARAKPPGSSWINSAVHEAPTRRASGWKRS